MSKEPKVGLLVVSIWLGMYLGALWGIIYLLELCSGKAGESVIYQIAVGILVFVLFLFFGG